jgi:hypothetical protein
LFLECILFDYKSLQNISNTVMIAHSSRELYIPFFT